MIAVSSYLAERHDLGGCSPRDVKDMLVDLSGGSDVEIRPCPITKDWCGRDVAQRVLPSVPRRVTTRVPLPADTELEGKEVVCPAPVATAESTMKFVLQDSDSDARV